MKDKKSNQHFLGILGDPAKEYLYSEEFYQILRLHKSNIFHLIGASETNVSKSEYLGMYDQFKHQLEDIKFPPFNLFDKNHSSHFSKRIGLFPSELSHLIPGPSFIFAPYPLNSTSKFLKIKATIVIRTLKYFVKARLLPIAYSPHGGKASIRTRSSNKINVQMEMERFYKARKNNWFEHYYLEAGSGEKSLNTKYIDKLLFAQMISLKNLPFTTDRDQITFESDLKPIIVPNSIYGGGIVKPSDLEKILLPSNSNQLVPQTIIIGNVSEIDISMTYDIIEKFQEIIENRADN